MNHNLVKVTIKTVNTKALIDSGATISCISQYALNKIDPNKTKYTHSDIQQVRGVGGEKHEILGKVTLPVQLQNHNFPKFLHFSKFAVSCYFGNGFLDRK